MKRSWLIVPFLFLLSGAAFADAPPAFSEGMSYDVVNPAMPTEAKPGQVEVVEFFWYGCPHCFALEPSLEAWVKAKPKDVLFRRVPGAFKDSEFYTDGQAFFTAQVLGIGDKIHEPLFNAIHLEGQDALRTDVDALRTFFGKFGVSPKDFDNAWNSFAVQTRLSEAAAIETRYNIMSVPTIIVDGKWKTGAGYKLASGQYMNSEQIMQCVDHLVQMARAEHKKK